MLSFDQNFIGDFYKTFVYIFYKVKTIHLELLLFYDH